MKSFQFDKSTSQSESFFYDVCDFLHFVEKHSSSQIEQVLQKIAYSEKVKNRVLINFKDITPDYARLASKNPEQYLKAKEEAKIDPQEKIDNEIITAIAKGQVAIQQVLEDPKKKPTTAPKITKPTPTPDPKTSIKAPVLPSIAKRGPSLGKPNTTTVSPGLQSTNWSSKTRPQAVKTHVPMPGEKAPLQTSSGAQNKNWSSRVGAQAIKTNVSEDQNKNMPSKLRAAQPLKTQVPAPVVPDEKAILQAKMEEVKEELQANEILPKTQVEEVENENKPKPNIAKFQVQETELVSKKHILEYMNAKKGIKEKVKVLTGDIKYHSDKEKKTKDRFLSRLTSHLHSVQDIMAREYEDSEHEKKNKRNQEAEEEEGPPKIEFFSLEVRDPKFPRVSLDTMKGLQVAQKVLVQLKKKMTLANEEFRNIVECSQIFQDDGEQMHPVDKYIKLFKSWYMKDSIDKEMQFLKTEVPRYLGSPDIRNVMKAAAETWKALNYFEPTEDSKKNGHHEGSNENTQQISWLNYTTKSTPNTTEITCSKSAFRPSKKALAGWKDGAKVVVMESSTFQSNTFQLLLGYLCQRHPVTQDHRAIENIKGANFGHLLKLLRLISIITQGECRNFPLFMVHSNN